MKDNKRGSICEYIACDTDRLYGSLPDAIRYLREIHAKHPDATLHEKWTGYEDMQMAFSWERPETDEEMSSRLKAEALHRKLEDEKRRKDAEKAARREQYLKLKREFG